MIESELEYIRINDSVTKTEIDVEVTRISPKLLLAGCVMKPDFLLWQHNWTQP